jgi:hypothetical protein
LGVVSLADDASRGLRDGEWDAKGRAIKRKRGAVPYDSLSDLPDRVRNNLPEHAQEIYRAELLSKHGSRSTGLCLFADEPLRFLDDLLKGGVHCEHLCRTLSQRLISTVSILLTDAASAEARHLELQSETA